MIGHEDQGIDKLPHFVEQHYDIEREEVMRIYIESNNEVHAVLITVK